MRHSKAAPVAIRFTRFCMALLLALMSMSPSGSLPTTTYAAEETKAPVYKDLDFTLTEGKPEIEKPAVIPIAHTQDLSPERVKELISRLPEIKKDTTKAFILPEQSLVKPDLPGTHTLEPFPPKISPNGPKPEKPVVKKAPPLTVRHISHTGAVDSVDQLSITFSQPMVPIGQANRTETNKFVTIKPQPEGSWKWVGTQTLQFDPKRGRFPKSTKYEVEIPQGITSDNGGKLETGQKWTIETPALTVKTFYPAGGPQKRAPKLVAILDQEIDKKKLLSLVQLTVAGKPFDIRPVSKEKLEADEFYKGFIMNLPESQWLAFEPTVDLPLSAKAIVTFKAGCPSAEGPIKTSQAQTFSFDVYGPLKLVSSPEANSSPEDYYGRFFTFSNPIDPKKFKETMVHIEPAAPDVKVTAYGGGYVTVQGRLKPYTKYTATFDESLPDTFGQTLGHKAVGSFITGAFYPLITMDQRLLTIPSTSSKMAYTAWAQGIPYVDITIYRVSPSDWKDFQEDRTAENIKAEDWPVAFKNRVKIGKESKAFDIDFKPHLKDGYGQFVVVAESSEGSPARNADRYRYGCSWVQVTNLGADVFRGKDLITLVTSLSEGKAVPGASVELCPNNLKSTTDQAGIAKIRLSEGNRTEFVVARKGADSVVLPRTVYGGSWDYLNDSPELKWFAVTDRNLYKPGEKINVKGWLRGLRLSETEVIELYQSDVRTVAYSVRSSDGKVIGKGTTTVDSQGGFSFETALPDKVNLGDGYITITTDLEQDQKTEMLRRSALQRPTDKKSSPTELNSSTNVAFKIQEFRRPEFEMKVASSRGNSMLLQEKTTLTANAKYYSGSGLSGSQITWTATATQGTYSPPGWSDYHFGEISFPIWGGWFGGHHGGFMSRGIYMPPQPPLQTKNLVGTTDSTGTHIADLKFNTFQKALPISCTCEATVQDVNRQTWSDKVTVLVHSADTYVGTKQSRSYAQKGEPIETKFIATDIDGKVVTGRSIQVEFKQRDTSTGNDNVIETKQITSSEQPQTLSFTPKKGGQYVIAATVTDTTGRKNTTLSQLWVPGDDAPKTKLAEEQKLLIIPDKKEYQPGDTAELMINSPIFPANGIVTIRRNNVVSTQPINVETGSHSLKIPITKDYYPNFAVHVYLSSKDNAYASGLVELKVPPKAKTLTLSATAAEKEALPGSDTAISIELKDNAGKPIAGGQVAVAVADEALLALANYKWSDPIESFYPQSSPSDADVHSRTYVVDRSKSTTTPPTAMGNSAPGAVTLSTGATRGSGGGFATMETFATAADGRMYGDEGSLAQASPRSAAPMRRMKAAGMVPPPPMVAKPEAMGAPRDPNQPIEMRTDFSALALFEPAVTTDVNGKATVKLHLPDSLTRYRIMAAAVSGSDHFGSAESNVTARLPLTVKPSAPRFLNFGDRCEFPMVVQNETDKPLQVEIAMRATNSRLHDIDSAQEEEKDRTPGEPAKAVEEPQTAGKAVTVPPRNRVEVRFPVATIDEGKAQFQCAVVSGAFSDAAEFAVPVMVPATMEAFATYGEIDKGAVVQHIDMPTDVYDRVGGLTITSSSTAMQALTDAYFYLYHYEYACSEQLSSRVIAMVSLENVLSAFGKLEGADRADFRGMIQRDIKELLTRQNSDGGFGLWKANEDKRWPYVSLQVIRALNLAKEKDYTVEADRLSRAKDYLDNIDRHIPNDYGDDTRLSLRARALNIRWLMNDSDPAQARKIIREALQAKLKKYNKKYETVAQIPVDLIKFDLPLECAGWLLPVISKDKSSEGEVKLLRRLIDSQIKETASTASSNDSGYGGWDYCLFWSPRRTDAILLESLMADQPDSTLIPKMVRGLLGHRKNGMWEGTQENGYVLQALDKYFSTYEKQTPDFETQMWLGKTLVGLEKYKGRTVESKNVEIPVPFIRQNENDILITKEGPGRLYYRIGLDYAPRNLNLKPADFGFAVERTYEGVENESDVKRDNEGIWHFKAGSVVRAKLKFKAPGTRYHVALMDPLAAGTEPLNAELAGTQSFNSWEKPGSPGKPIPFIFWRLNWYEHQNLRDHQAEAFTSFLGAGEYNYTYMVRATTPGKFRVPPTKAEEMYSSETFGRSATETVIIE